MLKLSYQTIIKLQNFSLTEVELNKLIEQYLNTPEPSLRHETLKEMSQTSVSFPLNFAQELLMMDLQPLEKRLILNLASNKEMISFEHFITSNIEKWDQNLASHALREWAARSPRQLWYRVVSIIDMPILSQRMKYTILDLSPQINLKICLEKIIKIPNITELSPAFHGLLIERCLQADYFDSSIDLLSNQLWKTIKTSVNFDQIIFLPTFAWMLKYHHEKLTDDNVNNEILKSLINICSQNKYSSQKLKNLSDEIDDFWTHFLRYWPPIWQRNKLSLKMVEKALVDTAHQNESLKFKGLQIWSIFSGINASILSKTVLKIKDPLLFIKSIANLESLILLPYSKDIVDKTKEFLQVTTNIEVFLKHIPPNLKLLLLHDKECNISLESRFHQIKTEEASFIKSNFTKKSTFDDYYLETKLEQNHSEVSRHEFYTLSYMNQNINITPKNIHSFWSMITHNWKHPNEDDINSISTLARKQPHLFQICYLKTLSQFKGKDAAVLKILDFIRSPYSDILKEVIHALGGIGTPRALQEIISCLTRPNFDISLKLEICEIIKNKNLDDVQKELRSALYEIKNSNLNSNNSESLDIYDNLSQLIKLDNINEQEQIINPTNENSTEVLDQNLNIKIPHYKILSSEAKRALRTAEFFCLEIETGKVLHSIDLSPVIDMQYKALELIFREAFDHFCFNFLKKGSLQHKLDILGYSRPIPKAMEEFEDYIQNLPIIVTIPYFSKFKLRKMLRSICLYKPGKRFTLDGIKAFSLFFLTFSRINCQYGLTKLVDIGFDNDEELFNFCKDLHVFQDLRNRAAHEGFHPEARNDLDGIWKLTSKIIDSVVGILDYIYKDFT